MYYTENLLDEDYSVIIKYKNGDPPLMLFWGPQKRMYLTEKPCWKKTIQ